MPMWRRRNTASGHVLVEHGAETVLVRYYYDAVLPSCPWPTRSEDFCSYEIMQTQPARRTGATKTECGRARIMQAVTLLTSVADRRLVGAEICTEQGTWKQSIGVHPIIHASIITDEIR